MRVNADGHAAVQIGASEATIDGDLALADGGPIVVFAHGSGSGRHSPRNQQVAARLRQAGLGTLLIDLLTAEEEAVDVWTGELRFDVDLLARRLIDATDWLGRQDETADAPVGYFGASTGAKGQASWWLIAVGALLVRNAT